MKIRFLCFSLLLAALSLSAYAEPQGTALPDLQTYQQLLTAIRETRIASQKRAEQAVDREKVREAWETGKLIQEHILLQKERADYGERMIPQLAFDIEVSETEIKYMLQFYKTYPIRPQADELSWAHYRELLSLNDDKEREEVTQQAVKEAWGRDRVRAEVRKRQSKPEMPAEMLTAVPGIVSLYRLVVAPEGPYKGQLVIDLGFSNYFKFGSMNEFKAGELIHAAPVKPSKKGLATRFHFKHVLPKSYLENVHLNVGNQYIVADESSLYSYPAYVMEVIDGDTFRAMIDLGFGIVTEQKLRLRGLDAPELPGSDGAEAKTFLEKKMKSAKQILVKTVKPDKYDRYLADVWTDHQYLNQALLDEKLAVKVPE